MHRARASRPRAFDSLPFLDPDPGRCRSYSSARSSKIKIRTSSRNQAQLALLRDEVRILVFDRMTENYDPQRPGSGSWEGKLSNPRGRGHEYAIRVQIFLYETSSRLIPRDPNLAHHSRFINSMNL